MVIAYARVSTDKQDNINQRILIDDYCKANNLTIDAYISVEASSKKSQDKRKITELYNALNPGDILITAELSRLGRDMLEVITLIFELIKKGVKTIFIRQPELNLLKESATKLLLSFYAYMAENERELISQRTKAGLEVARSKGKVLGRPKGSLSSMYDEDIETIKELLDKEFCLSDIWKYIGKKGSYVAFYNFCKSRGLKQKYSDQKRMYERIRNEA